MKKRRERYKNKKTIRDFYTVSVGGRKKTICVMKGSFALVHFTGLKQAHCGGIRKACSNKLTHLVSFFPSACLGVEEREKQTRGGIPK